MHVFIVCRNGLAVILNACFTAVKRDQRVHPISLVAYFGNDLLSNIWTIFCMIQSIWISVVDLEINAIQNCLDLSLEIAAFLIHRRHDYKRS